MRRPPALAFLLVTVFVDMLGLGIVVPVIPPLMTAVTSDPGAAAHWSGWIDASYGVTQFLAAPLLGRLADRYGRRPVLVFAVAALGLDYLAHALAGGPVPMLAAHALAGALAGTTTVVNACIADLPAQQRPRAYGYVGAAFSIGFVAGPVLGGMLGAVNLRAPFLAAAALAATNALYGALVLPESRPGDGRTSIAWRVANPVSSIVAVLRRPGLAHLTVARLLADIARMTTQVTWTFVVIARFGWGTATVGVVMAGGALLGAAAGALLAGPYARRLGLRRASIVSACAKATGLVGYGVFGAWWLAPAVALDVLAGMGDGAARSWIAAASGAQEQGTVQGALTGISAIAEAAVPVAATTVFAASLASAPGLVLVLAGAVAAGSALVLRRVPRWVGAHTER